jgi:ABC-type multidrug transport system ATPase subunit
VVLRPAATAIGYLSAGTGVYLDLTVAENLRFARQAYASACRRRVAEALGVVGGTLSEVPASFDEVFVELCRRR